MGWFGWHGDVAADDAYVVTALDQAGIKYELSGDGGTVTFSRSGKQVEVDGDGQVGLDEGSFDQFDQIVCSVRRHDPLDRLQELPVLVTEDFEKGTYDTIYYGAPFSSTDPTVNADLWLSSGAFHFWNPRQTWPWYL